MTCNLTISDLNYIPVCKPFILWWLTNGLWIMIGGITLIFIFTFLYIFYSESKNNSRKEIKQDGL